MKDLRHTGRRYFRLARATAWCPLFEWMSVCIAAMRIPIMAQDRPIANCQAHFFGLHFGCPQAPGIRWSARLSAGALRSWSAGRMWPLLSAKI
jgi:hypothetical protein